MSPSSSIPGFSSPAAGPDQPLAMLAACHERVERQCRTLERLLPHLAQHGSDRPAQEAAQAVLRYFDEAAPNHHADEEHDLFGLLAQACKANPVRARELSELTQTLIAQHRQLERQWQEVRPMLHAVSLGQTNTMDADLVHTLIESHRAHVTLEDRSVLPMAAQLLSPGDIQQLGKAMAHRRQRD